MRDKNDVTLKDFQPINTWYFDEGESKWPNGAQKYLIDATTKKRYWNQSENVVRFKCFLLTPGTLIVHSVASLVNVAYRIMKLVTFSHFWADKEEETSYSLKERLRDAGKDLLRVPMTPIAFLGLELAAIYGIFTPYNGRKLYATIERAQYGNSILAPCFQPNPKYHAFGGDPEKQNAF